MNLFASSFRMARHAEYTKHIPLDFNYNSSSSKVDGGVG